MRRLGLLTLTLAGRRLRLELYHAGPQAGNVAFLPFRDRTCGKESYGPGRYLNVELIEGRDYLISSIALPVRGPGGPWKVPISDRLSTMRSALIDPGVGEGGMPLTVGGGDA